MAATWFIVYRTAFGRVVRAGVAGVKSASEGENLFRRLSDRGFGDTEEVPGKGGRTVIFRLVTTQDFQS